jgi:acetyl esterase/lipase
MSRHTRKVSAVLLAVLAAVANQAVADDLPKPNSGDEAHQAYRSQSYGSGGTSYWLFEPDEPSPAKAPVVVFHHGWLAVNPGVYGAWLEHLTQRGFIVIFPRYHTDGLTPPADFLPNALIAVRDAFDVLETAPGHVRPDRSRFAIMGHSAGGNLSAQMAAVARETGLPEPKAVISLMPGEVRPVTEPDLGDIPAETLLVVVAGDQDALVGDTRARQIHAEATAVPLDRKAFLLFRTDRNGPVALVADHLAPCAGLDRMDSGDGPFRHFQMSHASVDILDRFGFWRVADLTLDAAFAGLTLAEATADGALFRDLGRWSDGRVVTPPLVGNDLARFPRVPSASGARLLPGKPDEFFRTLLRADEGEPPADPPFRISFGRPKGDEVER